MKSRSFSLLIVAIVAVNLATLAVWWHKTHRQARWTVQGPSPTYFKYGDRAPSFRFFSTKGQEIDSDSLGGKTVLLYFFDAEEDRHWSEILYAAMLAKAYEDRALEVVAVSKSRPRRLAEYVATVGVPVVVDDDSLSAHELFHMRECCGGTVLVDSAGVIRFITPYLAPGGTMRQVHFGHLWHRKGVAVVSCTVGSAQLSASNLPSRGRFPLWWPGIGMGFWPISICPLTMARWRR